MKIPCGVLQRTQDSGSMELNEDRRKTTEENLSLGTPENMRMQISSRFKAIIGSIEASGDESLTYIHKIKEEEQEHERSFTIQKANQDRGGRINVPVTKLNIRTPTNMPPWQPPEEEVRLDTKRDKINKMSLALFNQSEALSYSKKLDKSLKDIIGTLRDQKLNRLKTGAEIDPSILDRIRDSEESMRLCPMPTLGEHNENLSSTR